MRPRAAMTKIGFIVAMKEAPKDGQNMYRHVLGGVLQGDARLQCGVACYHQGSFLCSSKMLIKSCLWFPRHYPVKA